MPRYDSPLKGWWILKMDGQRLIGAARALPENNLSIEICIETRKETRMQAGDTLT